MQAVKQKPAMFTKTRLKERGWTDSLITKFFPVPTVRKKNWNYPGGPDVLLYNEEQVVAIEKTDEFQAQKAKAAIRSARGKAIAEKMHAETRAWAASLPAPVLPDLTEEQLCELACASYNAHHFGEADKRANINSSDEFLDRICVNYLRHKLTDYEELLYDAAGKIGASDARIAICERIFDAIADAYPWLSDECYRQSDKRLRREIGYF